MPFTEISIQTGSVKFAILEARKISKACKGSGRSGSTSLTLNPGLSTLNVSVVYVTSVLER